MPNYSPTQAALSQLCFCFPGIFSQASHEERLPYLKVLTVLLSGGPKDDVIKAMTKIEGNSKFRDDLALIIERLRNYLSDKDISDFQQDDIVDISVFEPRDQVSFMLPVTTIMGYLADRVDHSKHDKHKKGIIEQSLRIILNSRMPRELKKKRLEELLEEDILYEMKVNGKRANELTYGIEEVHNLRGVLAQIIKKSLGAEARTKEEWCALFTRRKEREDELDNLQTNMSFNLAYGDDQL